MCAIDATVVLNEPLCRDHVRMELVAEQFPPSVPGQFLQLLCHGEQDPSAHSFDWVEGEIPSLSDPVWTAREPFLRRPFSVADRVELSRDRAKLTVISRNIGPGTDFLDRLRPNDKLNISGPLGRGFQIPDKPRRMILVGGGVGIPPLLYLARILAQRGASDVTAIFGATTAELVPLTRIGAPARDGSASRCVALPGDAPFSSVITTDDGSLGLRGRVTDALARLASVWTNSSVPLVFACGPDGMLHAVAKLTRQLGWDCQLCIEKNMGCGLGTCLSCVARVFDSSKPAGWRWALSCTEGPVFERDRLVEYA